jgi:hypothetical protein
MHTLFRVFGAEEHKADKKKKNSFFDGNVEEDMEAVLVNGMTIREYLTSVVNAQWRLRADGVAVRKL